MDKLSISEVTTYRWSFEEDVASYKEAGIPAIGVWRQKLSDFGEEKGIELIRDSGLAVSSLFWAGGFTGSDGRSFKDSVADAKEAVELAASLDAGCLIVYTGARGGHTHNHARRLIKGALTELCPYAGERNVQLAVEPMHSDCSADWTFLAGWDETLSFLDSISDATLKFVFDTYHMGHDSDVVARISEIAPRIALVQLGDSKEPPQGEQNRCALGEGQIPLGDIVAALEGANYEGYYEIELMGEEIEITDYKDLITKSQETVKNIFATA